MKKFLKEYFSFSPGEMRVITIISSLIFLSLVSRILIPEPDGTDFQLSQSERASYDSFVASLEKICYEQPAEPEKYLGKPEFRTRKVFDPDSVTRSGLESMGFPPFVAGNLVRYREAGGKFRNKTDLKKIYGFTDSLYSEWEDFIFIPGIVRQDSVKPESLLSLTDLNSADSSELVKIKGIGPYFATRILQYRERLGGYSGIDQLLEIKGMDTVKFNNFCSVITADTTLINKINLNTASREELGKHPYISYRFSQALIQYRNFAGAFRDPSEILTNNLTDEKTFRKIRIYLMVND